MTQTSNSQIRLRCLVQWSLICSLIACFTCQVFSDTEETEVTTVYFNVPEGEATDSLKEVARQADVDIVFPGRLLRKVRTPAVNGEYALQEVFDLMLAGTSLAVFQHMESGVYTIRKAETADNANGDLKPVNTTPMNEKKQPRNNLFKALLALAVASSTNISSQAQEESVFTLTPFEVSAKGDSPYGASSAISAHIAELPLTEIPIQMNILTADMLEDLSVFTNDDFNIAIPGASNSSVGDGENVGTRLRGFSAPTFVNGFLAPARMDPIWVERVEVAKGPAAVLYGSGSTGGVVNKITKQPRYAPSTTVSLGVGDSNFRRAILDTTGPIGDGQDATWAYRFIAQAREVGSQIKFDNDSDISFYGALRGRFNEDKIIVDLLHGYWDSDDNNQRLGAPDRPERDPLDRFSSFVDEFPGHRLRVTDKWGLGADFHNGGPQEFLKQRTNFSQIDLTFNLHEDFTVRAGLTDYDTKIHVFNLSNVWQWLADDKAGIPYQFGVPGNANVDVDIRPDGRQATRLDALWTPNTGEIEHKIVMSFRNSRRTAQDNWQRRRVRIRRTQEDVDRGYFLVTKEFQDMMFTTEPEVIGAMGNIGGREIVDGRYRINRVQPDTEWTENLSLTDHISFLGDRAHVLLGASYIDGKNNFDPDYAYQAGTIFEVGGGLHAYANFSTDFVPTRFFGENDVEQFTTQEGEGIDVGLRFHMNDGKLTGSVGYFSMERTNIPRRRNVPDDPTTPEDEGTSFFVLSGKEENTGYEFTLDYRPNENWSINFQATMSDPVIAANESDPRLEGLPMEDTVDDALNLATRYRFTEGVLEGYTFGLAGYWRNNGTDDSLYERRFRQTSDYYVVNTFVEKDLILFGNLDSSVRLDFRNAFDADDKLRRQGTYERGRYIFGTLKMRF